MKIMEIAEEELSQISAIAVATTFRSSSS